MENTWTFRRLLFCPCNIRSIGSTLKVKLKLKLENSVNSNNEDNNSKRKRKRIYLHYNITCTHIPWHLLTAFSHPGLQRHFPSALSSWIHSPLLWQMPANSSDVGSELSAHLPATLTISDLFMGAIVSGISTRLPGKVFFGHTLYVTRKEFKAKQAPWSWIARNTSEVPSLMNSDILTVLTMADLLEMLLGNDTVFILL